MIVFLRNSKIAKFFIILMLISFLNQLFIPLKVHALTGGPSQPEVQSFEPIATSEMVDIFSGDFVYNIPLLDVGGYPVNISYHSGVTMDQEASWVGLGWNINPGCITRNMRGIPDEFNKDTIIKQNNIRKNWTFMIGAGGNIELFGFGDLSLGAGISYNNYKGLGIDYSLGLGIGPIGINFGFGSQSGMDISLSASLDRQNRSDGESDQMGGLKGSASIGYNSRTGLKDLCINVNVVNSKIPSSMGIGNSATVLSFANTTYVPNVTPGMTSAFVSVNIKGGLALFGLDPSLYLKASYSEQNLREKEMIYSAYGYDNSEAAMYDEYGMMDINREKDGYFSKYTRNLPVTNFTYDLYSVSGQGTGGMFRPYRSDVGAVNDPLTSIGNGGIGISSVSASIEIGAGAPPSAKIGGNIIVGFSNGHSGRWHNEAEKYLKFVGDERDNPYEPFYFKYAGEKTLCDANFYSHLQNTSTVAVPLSETSPISGKRTHRDKRNQMISYLTAGEASKYGLQKVIINVNYDNTTGKLKKDSIWRCSEYHKIHHISEITSVNPDGTRYIYGIPAYNTKQTDATFNVDPQTLPNITSVDYDTAHDNTINNTKGTDHYFSSTKLPPYAHSYLLTAVLSADYVDLTGDGPTDDDLGSYTLFHYQRTSKTYKWRVPYDKANFISGLRCDGSDDKGSYVYGVKEMWYLTAIETKTHIAMFHKSTRYDGLGANGENGRNLFKPDSSYKLDSLKLYSKSDFIKNGKQAIPIKTVYFEYDYGLCKGTDNHSTNDDIGKLTLKKIWFKYQKNTKGRLSPYVFEYTGDNPRYDMKSYDRWGNYKKNDMTVLSNSEFPYVDQTCNRDTLDKWASAWCMTDITLPSGGKIHINYEADDYAYVQDRAAMEMIKVAGVGNSSEMTTNNNLYDDGKSNLYLFFRLRSPLNDINELKRLYIKNTTKLYFNFLVKLAPKESNYEYIAGYSQITRYGIASDNNYGYVMLSNTTTGDNGKGQEANPVSKAAWQFIRLNAPFLAHPAENMKNSQTSSFSKVVDLMLGSIFEVKSMILGYNEDLKIRHFAREFDPLRSWIRLVSPGGKKIGGGVRVKKLEFSDEWSNMTNGENNAVYGQEYAYTMDEKQPDGSNATISSGVSSYEPLIGGDENPFRLPLEYAEKNNLSPDNTLYMDAPMGECFFPSPQVGYRRVTVRNLPNTTIHRHATGFVVHEFYTAYDFPTVTEFTPIQTKFVKPNFILSLLGFKNRTYGTASQGYKIELNDMHGKPKAEWTYAENAKEFLTGIKYLYKVDNQNALKQHLNNNVKILNKDGHFIDNAMIGVDIDAVGDFREKEEKNSSVTIAFNLDGFTLVFIPVVIPIILTPVNLSQSRVESMVVTKVVNRYGILDKTIAYDGGAQLETQNVAYDGETGEVLLTKTQNEYGDNAYTLNYPAHWAYEGMGLAYKNTGLKFDATISGGEINDPSVVNLLVPGDEFVTYPPISSNGEHYWVLDKNSSKVSIIDKFGNAPATLNSTFKIIRSGRRNQQSTSIGSVTSKTNPLNSSNHTFTNFNKVTDAKAVEYSDEWQMSQGTGVKKCKCGLTDKGRDFLTLMDALAKGNKFSLPSYDLVNEPAFNNGSLYLYFNGPNHLNLTAPFDLAEGISGMNQTKTIDVLTASNSNTYLIYQRGTSNPTGFGIIKYNSAQSFDTSREYSYPSGTSVKINSAKIIGGNIILTGEYLNGSSYAMAIALDTVVMNLMADKRLTLSATKAYNVCGDNTEYVFVSSYHDNSDIKLLFFRATTDLSSISLAKTYIIPTDKFKDDVMSIWYTSSGSGTGYGVLAPSDSGLTGIKLENNLEPLIGSRNYVFEGVNADNLYNSEAGIKSNDGFSLLYFSNGSLNGTHFNNFYDNWTPNGSPPLLTNYLTMTKLTKIKDLNASGTYMNDKGVIKSFLFTTKLNKAVFNDLPHLNDLSFDYWGSDRLVAYGLAQQEDQNSNMQLTGDGTVIYYDDGSCKTWPITFNNTDITYQSIPLDWYPDSLSLGLTNIGLSDISNTHYSLRDCYKGGRWKIGDECFFGFHTLFGKEDFSLPDVTTFSNLRPLPREAECPAEVDHFMIDATLKNNQTITLKGYSCIPIGTCSYCGTDKDTVVNPYLQGIRGNWRPKCSYVFYDKNDTTATRLQSGNNSNYNGTNTKEDGTYKSFVPFWTPGTNGSFWQPPSNLNDPSNPWMWQSEVTKYSPYGFELENKDPLGIYSSALYGYRNKLPLAVAHNAKYSQIAYDGFEDYEMTDTLNSEDCKINDHWSFREDLTANGILTNKYAHSGLKSLRFGKGYVAVERKITNDPPEQRTGLINKFYVLPQDNLGLFSPSPGSYTLSYWVKLPKNSDPLSEEVYLKKSNNAVTILTLLPSEDNITVEGWTRIEKKFTIPDSIAFITMVFSNPNDGYVYLDDVRIHPFNANMKTFVYDPITLKLLAQLDENNYTTFYEYDEEGILIRVKQETEKGIVTLKETRQNNSKRP